LEFSARVCDARCSETFAIRAFSRAAVGRAIINKEGEMNRFVWSVSRLLVSASLAACCATASQAQQGPPDGLGVRVLNTPLPVTGSTTVSGSVAASQSGTWNVTATIANKQTPFAKLLCIGSQPCVSGLNGPTTPALPFFFIVPTSTASGGIVKELVVEFVSGDCVGTGRTTRIDLFGTSGSPQLADTGDNFSANKIPMSVAQFNDTLNENAVQSFAQRTQLTYLPGTTISINVDFAKSGVIVCKVQLNGHFITN
jgi:hypothetical protein